MSVDRKHDLHRDLYARGEDHAHGGPLLRGLEGDLLSPGRPDGDPVVGFDEKSGQRRDLRGDVHAHPRALLLHLSRESIDSDPDVHLLAVDDEGAPTSHIEPRKDLYGRTEPEADPLILVPGAEDRKVGVEIRAVSRLVGVLEVAGKGPGQAEDQAPSQVQGPGEVRCDGDIRGMELAVDLMVLRGVELLDVKTRQSEEVTEGDPVT